MVIEKGKKVRHQRTGAIEEIVSPCIIKFTNGEWVDGVVYQGNDRYTGKPMVFVRELNDFNNEFIEVTQNDNI